MEEKTRQELLKSIYEQHWLHARHVEYERLWLTTALIPAIGGLFSLLVLLSNPVIPLVFTIVVCTLGYCLCLTWRAAFLEHTTLAREMAEQWPDLKDYAPYTRPRIYGIIKIQWRWLSANQLFMHFYSLVATCALGLGISEMSLCPWWHIATPVPFLAAFKIARWYDKKEGKYREEMKRRRVDMPHDENK